MSVIQCGVPGVWAERGFVGFKDFDQGMIEGVPIGFLIVPYCVRGQLRCIFISLIFDLPDVLIGHFVHDEAEGLVELEEEHQGHEVRSVVKPEAYEDVFIVQDDAVEEEHYGQLDCSQHKQLEVIIVLVMAKLMSNNGGNLLIGEWLLILGPIAIALMVSWP